MLDFGQQVLDGDGAQEIYVVADQQHEVRRYRWSKGSWERNVISPIGDNKITFNIYAGRF